MKIVCDTNIIISGLIFPGGISDKVIRAVIAGSLENFTSPDLLTELRRILVDKFNLSKDDAEDGIQPFLSCSKIAYPTQRLKIVKDDDADNRVLECVQAAKVEFLITGDKKHLLPLKKFEGATIISPKDFGLLAGII